VDFRDVDRVKLEVENLSFAISQSGT
jgi:hypothetical protein